MAKRPLQGPTPTDVLLQAAATSQATRRPQLPQGTFTATAQRARGRGRPLGVRQMMALERNQAKFTRRENLLPYNAEQNRENIRIGTMPFGRKRTLALKAHQKRKAQLASGLTPHGIEIQGDVENVSGLALPFGEAQIREKQSEATRLLAAAGLLDQQGKLAGAHALSVESGWSLPPGAGYGGADPRAISEADLFEGQADAAKGQAELFRGQGELAGASAAAVRSGAALPPGSGWGGSDPRVAQAAQADLEQRATAIADERKAIRDEAREEARVEFERQQAQATSGRTRFERAEDRLEEIDAARNSDGTLQRRNELIAILVRSGEWNKGDSNEPSEFADFADIDDEQLMLWARRSLKRARTKAGIKDKDGGNGRHLAD
jgi:hypothetical protein